MSSIQQQNPALDLMDVFVLPPIPKLVLPRLPPIADHRLHATIFEHIHSVDVSTKSHMRNSLRGNVILGDTEMDFQDLACFGGSLTGIWSPSLDLSLSAMLIVHGVGASIVTFLQERYPTFTEGEATVEKPMRRKTKGESFEYIYTCLEPILEQISEFAIKELQREEERLQVIYPKAGQHMYPAPPEWSEEDKKAKGAKQILHMSGKILGSTATYEFSEVAGKWVIIPWRAVCTAQGSDGKQWTSEAVRFSKKAAGDAAAWKICEAMGITRAEKK
ncbi:uncharacterized protein I303_105334 [Kwoniella dejecticola CBS 10117]|uniref:Uncharacterized protein n=1 Tax=Kwoniella dejecticola CBS 10117 TaxID=1296121 RepID=A0A1A6A2S9_9TREE|nr:uncharacterized protein I303_05219 [Kwoniella dejecticola CBS 10117]OBR84361.1 hypothetical protein I303_05219 [Kwoniella dejecticola CBS 10117]